jgi:hypothetical protein
LQANTRQLRAQIYFTLHTVLSAHSFRSVDSIPLELFLEELGASRQSVVGSSKSITTQTIPLIQDALTHSTISRVRCSDFSGLSVCADTWEDATGFHLVGLTIHQVDEQMQLDSQVLDIIPLPERQTADALRSNIQNQLTKLFGAACILKQHVYCCTTDGASNIRRAAADLLDESSRIHCLCHVVDLAVDDVVTQVCCTTRVCIFQHVCRLTLNFHLGAMEEPLPKHNYCQKCLFVS